MKDFLQEENREKIFRVGLVILVLLATIIYFVVDYFDNGEEIKLDEPQNISQVKSPSQNSSEKINAVIGANADEIYISDPLKNPAPPTQIVKSDDVPAKVEEKISPPLPPTESVIFVPPTVEVPKPPDEKFFLRGIAIGDNKTALVEKIFNGKVESLFLQIGDKINDKIIVDISADSVTFDDGGIFYVK